jgi:hypothetical protein
MNCNLCASETVRINGQSELPPAKDRLAVVLFSEMEHLDPSEKYDWDRTPEENWFVLDEWTKDFYRTCINRLACEPQLWEALFKFRETLRRQSCTQELKVEGEKRA